MRVADLILLVPLLPVLIVVSALFQISLPLLGVLDRNSWRVWGQRDNPQVAGAAGDGQAVSSMPLASPVAAMAHLILKPCRSQRAPALSFLYMMFTVTDAIALEATFPSSVCSLFR